MGYHLTCTSDGESHTLLRLGIDNVSSMELRDLTQRIEVLAKAGTFVLVALYVAGFLVVSLSNASYGIVEFSLFRARVLSAGVLFGLCVGFPVLQAARSYALYGLPTMLGGSSWLIRARDLPTLSLRSVQALIFFSSSVSFAFLLRFLTDPKTIQPSVIVIWLVSVGVITGVVMAIGGGLLAKPLICVPVAVVLALSTVAAIAATRDWELLRNL